MQLRGVTLAVAAKVFGASVIHVNGIERCVDETTITEARSNLILESSLTIAPWSPIQQARHLIRFQGNLSDHLAMVDRWISEASDTVQGAVGGTRRPVLIMFAGPAIMNRILDRVNEASDGQRRIIREQLCCWNIEISKGFFDRADDFVTGYFEYRSWRLTVRIHMCKQSSVLAGTLRPTQANNGHTRAHLR